MKFFVNENVPNSVVQLLRDEEQEVFDIKKSQYKRYSDERLVELAKKETAIIITQDKDFANIYQTQPTFRLIRFQLTPTDREHLPAYLKFILSKYHKILRKEAFFIVAEAHSIKVF